MKPLRAIDLCCGAGGWACAARGLPIEFLAVVDTAADCLETWRVNHQAAHPRCRLLDCDLSLSAVDGLDRQIRRRQRIDLVLGGIPCEPISIARFCGGAHCAASKVVMHQWHALLDNVLRLVAGWRPQYWCIEDVIQIERQLPLPLWHGREIPYRRLDAADFGPQRRLRTFLGEFPAPDPADSQAQRTLGECLLPGPHRTVAHADQYEPCPDGHDSGKVYGDRIRLMSLDQPSATVVSGYDRGSRQRRAMCVEHNGRRRQLSFQETAKLQGFPEDFLFAAPQYRAIAMIGQAIQIDLGRAILRAICREAECRPINTS